MKNICSMLRVFFSIVLFLLYTSPTLQEKVGRTVAENPKAEVFENGRRSFDFRKLLSASKVIESKVQTSKEGDTTVKSFSNTKTVALSDIKGTATSTQQKTLVLEDPEISRIASSVSSSSGPGAPRIDKASSQNPSRTNSTSENRSRSSSSSSKSSKSSTSKSGAISTRPYSSSSVSSSSGGSASTSSSSKAHASATGTGSSSKTSTSTFSSTSHVTTETPTKSASSSKAPAKSPSKSPRGSTQSKRKDDDDDDDDDNDDDGRGGGMSRGATAGTAVGSIFGFIFLVSGIALCSRYRTKQRKEEAKYKEISSEERAEVDPDGNPQFQDDETT